MEGCLGKWLVMAIDILTRNGIDVMAFAGAVCVLLQKGRGKYRNIYLKGPANCGKIFMLNQLNHIYSTFGNPATTTFAWVGAEDADVIFSTISGGLSRLYHGMIFYSCWKVS